MPLFLCHAKYLSLLCHEIINPVSLVVLRNNFAKGLESDSQVFSPSVDTWACCCLCATTKDEGTKIACSNAYLDWLESLEKLHLRVVVWWCQADPDPKREQFHSSRAVCASPFLLYWHISVAALKSSLRNCSVRSQWDQFPGLIQKHLCVFKQRTCVGRMEQQQGKQKAGQLPLVNYDHAEDLDIK